MKTMHDFLEVVKAFEVTYKKIAKAGDGEYSGFTLGFELDLEISFDQPDVEHDIQMFEHGIFVDCLYVPYNKILLITEI